MTESLCFFCRSQVTHLWLMMLINVYMINVIFTSMNVALFQYLINCLCKMMMTAVKEAMGTVREMGSRRNSSTKGVSITCCIRQSANILPDTEPQLHFPCFVPLAVQKRGRKNKTNKQQQKEKQNNNKQSSQV